MWKRQKRKGGWGREGGLAASCLSHLVPHYSPALYSSSEKRPQAFILDEDRKRERRRGEREREGGKRATRARLMKARGEKEKSQSVKE